MDICLGSEPSQPVNNVNTTTDQPNDTGKISAYYSLVFPNFTFYIQTLDVTIGRRTIPSASSPSSSSNPDSTPQVDVDLGALKSVSRLHARIEYDQDMDRFVLAVIGRNGAWVDGVWAASGTRAALGERSQIQIASRTFEFVLPPPSPPEDTPSPSSHSSTNRVRSPSLDVTSISPPSSLPSHSPVPPQKQQHPLSDSLSQPSVKPTSKKRKKGEDGLVLATGDLVPPITPKPHPEEIPPKPPHTYAQLIYKALKGMGEKATLQEVCTWIMNTFEYYKYADSAWMSSVRHNLSSNRAFKKLERCGGDRGKGFFWCLDDTVDHSHLNDPEVKIEPSVSSISKDSSTQAKKAPADTSSKKTQKNSSLPPPLTYAPRAISGPAVNQASVVQASAPSVPALKPNGTTGVFAYPYTSNPNQNPYAALAKWSSQQAVHSIPASTPPTNTLSPPPAKATTSTAPASASKTPSSPKVQSGAGPGPTQAVSQSPAPTAAPSTASNISLSIVLGSIPATHSEYAAGHPNNSKTEGYIVWDGGTLILDPNVFGNLTKETLAEYEKMGVQAAVKLLSKQAARARRAKAGGGRGRRGRGGSAPPGDRKDKAKPLGSPFTNAPLPANRGPSKPMAAAATPAVTASPTPVPGAQDSEETIIVVDDSDEEPAAKRQKMDVSNAPPRGPPDSVSQKAA